MSALDSMVRVHRWILDEKRQKLAEVERFAAKMREELERLDETMEAEREAASRTFESQTAYAAFRAAWAERRKRLSETVEGLEREVESARDEVSDAFRELKGYEGARERAIKRELDKRNKREQLALDETAISIYRRRQSEEPSAGG